MRSQAIMNLNFVYVTNLQYKVKSLQFQVDEFKSGEKYIRMRSDFRKQLAEKTREINALKRELESAHNQVIKIRDQWMGVFDDLEKEHSRKLDKMERQVKAMEARWLKAERQNCPATH